MGADLMLRTDTGAKGCLQQRLPPRPLRNVCVRGWVDVAVAAVNVANSYAPSARHAAAAC